MLREAAFLDELLGDGVNAEVEAGEAIVGDFGVADADGVVDTLEMWRGVEAGRVPDAVRMEARVAAVEPLPLVPAMSTERNWG